MNRIPFILSTDWWTDCDDAVAVRLAARAHKNKKINLLGVCINAAAPDALRSLDAFLTLEGINNLPISIDLDGADFTGTPVYQTKFSHHPSRFTDNAQGENPVSFYRRLLASCPGKAEIAEIGFPQTLIALLNSAPDEYSPLSGKELVMEKVAHLWVMAGKWDKNGEKEHNFCNNARSRQAAKALCDFWPTPVTFLGFEVGVTVITGEHLAENDHLKELMTYHGSENGRCSWDPMLIHLFLSRTPENAGYRAVYGKASVNEETGCNFFTEKEDGSHRYVVKTQPDAYYEKVIDGMIASK